MGINIKTQHGNILCDYRGMIHLHKDTEEKIIHPPYGGFADSLESYKVEEIVNWVRLEIYQNGTTFYIAYYDTVKKANEVLDLIFNHIDNGYKKVFIMPKR